MTAICSCLNVLTHWSQDKHDRSRQTIYFHIEDKREELIAYILRGIFALEKMLIWEEVHEHYYYEYYNRNADDPIDNKAEWFQITIWCLNQ